MWLLRCSKWLLGCSRWFLTVVCEKTSLDVISLLVEVYGIFPPILSSTKCNCDLASTNNYSHVG